MQPDLVDQVLFDQEFEPEMQRKRTTSVSKMERKDSAAPEEEEEEERPALVNGLTGENADVAVFLVCRCSTVASCSWNLAFFLMF